MRLGIGHPQPVRFEERTLRGSLDRSFGGAAARACPFGHFVREFFHDVGDIVEEFVDGDEGGTADVPMRLLDLRVQVDGSGEVAIEQSDRPRADLLRQVVGSLVH